MRSKRFDGPLVVLESDTDPGDMGEPREFWSDEDKATVLVVPSAHCWPHGLGAFDGDEEPLLAKVREGWAAVGNGWAVFAPTPREVRGKYKSAQALHAEIRARADQ
jgi:hypothetical protein